MSREPAQVLSLIQAAGSVRAGARIQGRTAEVGELLGVAWPLCRAAPAGVGLSQAFYTRLPATG